MDVRRVGPAKCSATLSHGHQFARFGRTVFPSRQSLNGRLIAVQSAADPIRAIDSTPRFRQNSTRSSPRACRFNDPNLECTLPRPANSAAIEDCTPCKEWFSLGQIPHLPRSRDARIGQWPAVWETGVAGAAIAASSRKRRAPTMSRNVNFGRYKDVNWAQPVRLVTFAASRLLKHQRTKGLE